MILQVIIFIEDQLDCFNRNWEKKGRRCETVLYCKPEFGHKHFDKRKTGPDPTSSARFTTHEVNTFNH